MLKNSNNYRPLHKTGAKISFSKKLPADFFKPFHLYEHGSNQSNNKFNQNLKILNESLYGRNMPNTYHLPKIKASSRENNKLNQS